MFKYKTNRGNLSFETFETYDEANFAGDFRYDVVEVGADGKEIARN